ncbi:uncharacterized protein LOC143367840 isoform X2 [Andrena cerasifolii]|uniref:uncharacterized protein LOC143367840 isoform X2 n=1 Tax=Andrena cerasifolii TaxID=2819439 RepID=UPI004037C932
MQRVLSLQMTRGLGESSEFVTKRMCCSFLFSVGFLCLLFGFLLGRFATQRAADFRIEKKRLELAGNGLETTEYLQHLLLKQLEGAPLDADFQTDWQSFDLKSDDVRRTNGTLSNLSLVHSVNEYQSCITAIVRGSTEPDRYVVLSASGEGAGIVLKLAKALNDIKEQHGWMPRRSLIFCLFAGASDPCSELLPSYMLHRIVAYIAIHHQASQGRGPFVVAGSDIVQSMVLEVASAVKDKFSYKDQLISVNNMPRNATTSRLTLNISHAVLSFVNNDVASNGTDVERGLRKIILTQILSQTVWRLSDCLIMKWNPRYLNETISKALESVNSTELLQIKEKTRDTSVTLLSKLNILIGRIDAIDSTNSLDTRILNDLLMDLDRALLCSDISGANWAEFFRLNHESFNVILRYLNRMVMCYEMAIRLLQD